jgi:hypothetical protein
VLGVNAPLAAAQPGFGAFAMELLKDFLHDGPFAVHNDVPIKQPVTVPSNRTLD